MDEGAFEQQMAKMKQLLTGREPEELRAGYFVQARSGSAFVAGTGVPPMGQLVERPSGLLVPVAAARRPAPIDLMATYLLVTEVFDVEPDVGWVIRTLRQLPLPFVLGFIADVMVRLQKPGISGEELDRQLVEEWFNEAGRAKVNNLLSSGGRRLFFPQAAMVLAKLAIEECPDEHQVGPEHAMLPVLLLTVAQHLTAPADDAEQRTEQLELGVVANHHFNAPREPAHATARYQRRWVELPLEKRTPETSVDVAALYEAETGVPLADVAAVTITLWSAAQQGRTRIAKSYFDTSSWPTERLEAVWNLLSADRAAMRKAMAEEAKDLDGRGHEWAFSAFERYPLFRYDDGSVEVLSPHFLLRRVYGWLPFFDIRAPLQERADAGGRTAKREAGKFQTCFRKLTERYGLEVLESLAATGGQRFFSEEELKTAYAATGVKLADGVLDYGDAFVVLEISTRQLQRRTAAAASYQALGDDIEALVEEARQVHSTIEQLKANEAKLTGQPATVTRRYHPVVVATEGFPVNPFTLNPLRKRLAEEGLLQAHDIAPVEILDYIELEMVEGLQEAGGDSLRALLNVKANGGLALMALRDFILVELGIQPQRPARVDKIWARPFEQAIELLGVSDDAVERVVGSEGADDRGSDEDSRRSSMLDG